MSRPYRGCIGGGRGCAWGVWFALGVCAGVCVVALVWLADFVG
jgi:hypothetical protein